MLSKIFKKTNLLILFCILLLAFFGLGKASAVSQLVSINTSDINEVGKETLEILLALKSLKLDDSLFDEIVFSSLVDFSIELGEKEKGRENPFEDFVFEEEAVTLNE
ncbi:hypothetical protein KKH36_00390 [Patescibacteria group bacterium]|nr:hypothetical protein [Patescibacteria group bacterium]